MADQTLKLEIQTSADVAGVNTATASVTSLEDVLQKLDAEAPEVAASLRQVSQATNQLEQAAAPATQGTKALTEEKGKMAKGSADSGRAVLETSRALEDLQYGIGGVLNNLPGLVTMLGGGAGLAGVISIVAVGLTQLFKHMGGAKEETDKLAAANADAIEDIAGNSMELAKQATILEASEKQAKALSEAWAGWSAALDKGTDSIKQNSEETDRAAESKKRLMEAEKALELARVDADDTLSDPEKIRRKNEIQGDFSEKAQQVEQEALAKQKALAEERAALEAAAAAGLEEKARRAEEAKKKAEDLERGGQAGEGRAAAGATLLGVVREELANAGDRNEYVQQSYVNGLSTATNVSDAQRQAQLIIDRLDKAMKAPSERVAAGQATDFDAKLLEDNKFIRDRLVQAIAMMTEGQAAQKALEKQGPAAKAEAEALGDPEAVRKEAEQRRKAAEDAARQANQFGRQASESGQIYEINRQRDEVTGGAAFSRAEEAEQKRKQQEQEKERKAAEKEAEALRAAQSGLRELSSLLPANSAAAGVASGAGGSVEQLTAIVEKLIEMMGRSSAVKGSPIEKKIQQLEQRVNALRQADKA